MRNVCVALLATLVLHAAPARADCNTSATEGVSANKQWKVIPKLDGTFRVLEWDATKKDFAEAAHGTFKFAKHAEHVEAFVADDGERFVLFDRYAGLLLLKKDGTVVKAFTDEELLTADEKTSRPGRDKGCHPEGSWAKGVAIERDRVRVTVHSGRVVTVAAATGVVQPEK